MRQNYIYDISNFIQAIPFDLSIPIDADKLQDLVTKVFIDDFKHFNDRRHGVLGDDDFLNNEIYHKKAYSLVMNVVSIDKRHALLTYIRKMYYGLYHSIIKPNYPVYKHSGDDYNHSLKIPSEIYTLPFSIKRLKVLNKRRTLLIFEGVRK